MERNIKLGNREIHMKSTAATAIFYKQQFKEDILIRMGESESDPTEFTMRAAYIMSGAHKEKNFFDWLDDFEIADFAEAMTDIISLVTNRAEEEEEEGEKKAKK